MAFHTSNPVFTSYFWSKSNARKKMSLGGIFWKSLLSISIIAVSTAYVWHLFFSDINIKWFTYGGMFTATILSLIISFYHHTAKYLMPFYSIAKGFFLGGISAYAHKRYPNLPLQAVALTISTFFVMLFLYYFKIIKVTKQFRTVVITTVSTIFLVYIVAFILSLFEIHFMQFLWGNSWWAIAFNAIAILAASFSLMLDFYYIDRQIYRAPKSKEWLATWGLVITLVWLYIEVLRMLKKFASRGVQF
jgi:uncharacterized YccA/Bax inhibitor family protein